MTIQQSSDQAAAGQQSQNDQANNESAQETQKTSNESTEQATTESTSEDTTETTENQAESVVEIDGERVPLSQIKEWRKGHMMSSDYTRKTQELAEEKRRLARQGAGKASAPDREALAALEKDPEAKAAVEVLKKLGFATSEYIDQRLEVVDLARSQEAELAGLLTANPDLKPFEKAIREIGKNSSQAWEDIIETYGFKPKTTLQRAKAQKVLKGAPITKTVTSQKSIADMTDAEYASWKAKNMGGSRFKRVSK